MTEEAHHIGYTVDGALARIELRRPDALNALIPDMGRELLAAVRRAAADDAVRAVLLTGAGRAFCAGADVKDERELTPEGHPDLTTRLREIYGPAVLAIRAAPKPVVAAVQGACAGLGVSFALACDITLAAADAYFLFAFVRVGLIPDGGLTAFLTKRIGIARATRLCMLGEKLSAQQAYDWGLIAGVHPAAELRSAAEEVAQRLAAGPTVALGSMKQAFDAAAHRHLAAQIELEATLQQKQAPTRDYAEARAAFAEKRAPVFEGR